MDFDDVANAETFLECFETKTPKSSARSKAIIGGFEVVIELDNLDEMQNVCWLLLILLHGTPL